MKNKLAKKLIISYVLILLTAIIIFCILATININKYLYNNIEEQLINENKYSLAITQNKVNNLPVGNLYKALTESITLVYTKNNGNKYNLISTTRLTFKNSNIIINQIDELLLNPQDSITKVTIKDKEYLATISKGKTTTKINDSKLEIDLYVVSLISIDDINAYNIDNLMYLFISALIIVVLTSIIISIIAKKITKPIVKLTKITKKYSKRDFSENYIANTNDEIEELSLSINHMANNLSEYDKQRDILYRKISHELKTPLTSIYGYAEGLKTNIFQNNTEPLDIIMSESLRIKERIEDLIYLSKLESSIEVINMEKSNISNVIESSIKKIESIAIVNDIDIIYTPKNDIFIKLDSDKIIRSLVNILSNCIKYTTDYIKIEIAESKKNVEITITDNGNGFDEYTLENLQKGMSKEKPNGSGIGLSIVKEIINAHKGDFIIANNINGGAIFKVILKK